MSTLSQQFLDTAKVVILATILVVGVQYVFAWSEPPGNPPPDLCPSGQPGCDPPVNVGGVEQEKTGLLNVGGLVSRYGLTVQGDIIADDINAAAGTFTSITATAGGAITGGSLDVGTGAVTAGQGAFTGGVTVGTPDGTIEYLQLDNKSSVGDPQNADCSELSEGGRMYYDSSIGVLYLCVQGRSSGIENGWKPVFMDYASTQK